MTKACWMALYAIIALASQGMLGHLGLPSALMPQFVIVMVVALSFSEVNSFGCLMSFAIGLLLDFSSAVLIGPWAGSCVVVFCALAMLSQRLFIDSGIAAMVITFSSVVVANVLFSLFGSEYPAVTWEYPQKVFGQAIVTALVAPLVLGFLVRRARRAHSGLVGRGSALSAV
jgi:rod shape-determining protein MreD